MMAGVAQDYLTFRVGREWYGIEVGQVIEVFRFMALTELPATTPDVLGLMTVRDNVLPVVDLRVLFGLAERTLKLDTPIIALRTEEALLGLVVDDTDNVEPLDAGQVTAYDEGDSPYIKGVGRLPDKLLLIPDIAKIHSKLQLVEAPLP